MRLFTTVELLSAPIEQVEQSLKNNPELSMVTAGLSSLQTEMMIETWLIGIWVLA